MATHLNTEIVNNTGTQIFRDPDTDRPLYRVDYQGGRFSLQRFLSEHDPLRGCTRWRHLSRHLCLESAEYAALSHFADAREEARRAQRERTDGAAAEAAQQYGV